VSVFEQNCSPYRNHYKELMQDVHTKHKRINSHNFPIQVINSIEKPSISGFSVHKNPFDIGKSACELKKMIDQTQAVPKDRDPTIKKSNFKTAEAKMTIGHNNKPLGDWDVLAIEDVNKF
jgi:hypothetical protein